MDRVAQLLDELDDLLDSEREALVGGDLDGLHRLSERKEDLIAKVAATSGVEQGALDRIRARMDRNHALFNSALAGIRAVSRRMSGLRQVRMSLETYDRAGRKHSLDDIVAPTVERHA